MRDDYHGHPNYVGIWAVLVLLLAVSLAASWLSKTLAMLLIFGIAAVKALLVLANFMHLRWEPRVLWGVAAAGLLCAACLFFGVYTDIVPVHLEIAR